MNFDVLPFDSVQGLSHWVKVAGFIVILVLIVTSVAAFASMGPRGLLAVLRQLYEGLRDIAELSLRRIWAIAMLTFREAIRRKALLVFGIFAVLFMFGSWFLTSADEKADIQIERHVVFVFTAVSWLVLPVVLMLACWGIPEDIKARSLHTVVTKPARRVEVVLGRMLGFSLIATLIVGVMGFVGYFWIDRQIPQAIHDRLVCKVPVYGKLSIPRSAGGGDEIRHQRRRRLEFPFVHRGLDQGERDLGLRKHQRERFCGRRPILASSARRPMRTSCKSSNCSQARGWW